MVGNGGGLISKKSCKINELKVQNLVFDGPIMAAQLFDINSLLRLSLYMGRRPAVCSYFSAGSGIAR